LLTDKQGWKPDSPDEKTLEMLAAYEATIEGWSHALDLRDRETEGHSRRVTELMVKLAEALGMSDDDIMHIRRGALLHDMGKIGFPDSILHKPAVLSDYMNWPQRQNAYSVFSLHAVADFPILNDDQCLGVLALGRDKPNYEFTSDQIQIGRFFAGLTALVLNNAQLREALREQSIRDAITGLYNRRYMEEALKQQLSRVTRHLHSLGIIMIDIDHFKRFNDTYGHAIGDALLRGLGQFLQSHIRGEDFRSQWDARRW
jgi:GAF domain-containing protein